MDRVQEGLAAHPEAAPFSGSDPPGQLDERSQQWTAIARRSASGRQP
jgi:hypothetical protein